MSKINTNIYIGIDVSKAVLDVYISLDHQYFSIDNDETGIEKLIKKINKLGLPPRQIHIAMEATSGLHRRLALRLSLTKFKTFILNPEHVWAYRRSIGKRAKNDKIDSRLIAEYTEKIAPKESRSYTQSQNELKELSTRRKQLTTMAADEKKRIKRCLSEFIIENIKSNIKHLEAEILNINKKIKQLIKSDPALRHKYNLLNSIPGIGEVAAITLISELPELGQLENKQCSSLVGVAPLVRESGTYKGLSKIYGGRKSVRSILYMAAFNALMVNKKIKSFADNLKAKTKPYKLMMVAVMRKLLTYANTVVKYNKPWVDA